MDVFEAIRGRRSIRSYRSEPIPDEDLRKILEAAIEAPSAGNLQPWVFIVVRDHATRRALAEAALGQYWMVEAPVIIAVCANMAVSSRIYGARGRNLYCIQDTAAAIENMLLAAYALGYGTCWVGAFYEEEVREVLRLPESLRPVALITLGKPAEHPVKPERKPLESVVHFEVYGSR